MPEGMTALSACRVPTALSVEPEVLRLVAPASAAAGVPVMVCASGGGSLLVRCRLYP